jgi:hypothetical protein
MADIEKGRTPPPYEAQSATPPPYSQPPPYVESQSTPSGPPPTYVASIKNPVIYIIVRICIQYGFMLVVGILGCVGRTTQIPPFSLKQRKCTNELDTWRFNSLYPLCSRRG